MVFEFTWPKSLFSTSSNRNREHERISALSLSRPYLSLGEISFCFAALLAEDKSIGCSWTGPKDRNFSSELTVSSDEEISFLGVVTVVEPGDERADDGGDEEMINGSNGNGGRIGKKGNK